MKQFLIIILCIIMFGCEKQLFDYRNKFLGDYSFKVHHTSWWGTGNTDTIYNYNGKIESGAKDNTLLIYFSDSVSYEPTVYEDGTLDHSSRSGVVFKGEFLSSAKIDFTYTYYWPGDHSTYDVTGEKQ